MTREGRRGFTLVELLVALALAGFLIIGAVQLTLAATGGQRLQQNLADLQENARFALSMMGREARRAGYHPQPWLLDERHPAIAPDALDRAVAPGDRVAFVRRSDRNCFANENPATDAAGRPLFWHLESVFEVTDAGNLAFTCRYGPDAASLTTQVNRLGLVENAEALQALYAEDSDGDANADRWVAAGAWQSESGIVGIRLAILLASPGRLGVAPAGDVQVLDSVFAVPDDGRLRRVYTTAFAIRGRSG